MIRSKLQCVAIAAGVAGLVTLASAAGETVSDWKIAGPFGGTATSVVVDPSNPSIVLAGARESLMFKSTDAGANWNVVNFPKRHLSELTSILVDPADSRHYLVGVIAADGGGMYESHDAGERWSVIKDISHYGVRAITYAVSQPSRFLAGTQNGVMLSDDCGKTWTRISDPENYEMAQVTAVAIDSKDHNVMYAGTSHLPWKSMDGGKTWTSIHTGMIDDSDVFSIYVNPADPANLLASACSGIYSSSDRGDLWHKLLGIPNTSRRTHVVRGDPSDASLIYAGTTTGLFKSATGGTAWKTLTNTQINWLTLDPSKPQRVYLAFDYEGLAKSENGGETITPINNGFVNRVISAITISGKKLVALETQEGETTGLFVSTDRGETWSQLRGIRTLNGVHLKTIVGFPDEDRTLLAATPHQMYKSTDAGMTWKTLPIRLVQNPPPVTEAKPAPVSRASSSRSKSARARTTKPVRAAKPAKPKPIIREISVSEVSGLYSVRIDSKNVLFAATDLGLLKSADAAEHWTLAEIPGSAAVTALYGGVTNSGTLIARAANGLYVSKDAGDHWSPMSFPLPPSDVNDIALGPDDSSPLLVATRVGLYYSHEDGKWFKNPNGLPASTVSSVTYSGPDKAAFAVEYGRLYRSTDAGKSWAEVPTALPLARIRQLWKTDLASTRIFGLTNDLGVIYRG
ncbi:MAG: hypothetical protein JOY85_26555 [Acidobacteriaceae bacterium]|nr:hypothetical protein [Acidobacteriaceae bacterium]